MLFELDNKSKKVSRFWASKRSVYAPFEKQNQLGRVNILLYKLDGNRKRRQAGDYPTWRRLCLLGTNQLCITHFSYTDWNIECAKSSLLLIKILSE